MKHSCCMFKAGHFSETYVQNNYILAMVKLLYKEKSKNLTAFQIISSKTPKIFSCLCCENYCSLIHV